MLPPNHGSSIWNPTAPMWKPTGASKSQLEHTEYESENPVRLFHPHGLSSPGRRPPVGDNHFSSCNHFDTSPMTTSPDRSVKLKSKAASSPILIHDSPSPSVITISSSSDRSNSLDITGMCHGWVV